MRLPIYNIKKNSIVIRVSEPSTYNQTKLIERIRKEEKLTIDALNIKKFINIKLRQ